MVMSDTFPNLVYEVLRSMKGGAASKPPSIGGLAGENPKPDKGL